MSERERWIVYPLLFFALGAAIRDKIVKEVRTDRLTADTIRCEAIAIVDPNDRQRVLAELSSTSAKPAGGTVAKRYGRLVLTDSDGREYFGLADDLLQMRHIRCEGVTVINPDDANKTLAQLTSMQAPPASPGEGRERFGVLALNNQSYVQVFGRPTRNPGSPKPQSQLPPSAAPESAGSSSAEPPPSDAEPAQSPPADDAAETDAAE